MSQKTEQEQYGEWYETQIEAWAERQNEARLYYTDDYPTRPVYSFSVETEVNQSEPEVIEDVICDWYRELEIHNCPF